MRTHMHRVVRGCWKPRRGSYAPAHGWSQVCYHAAGRAQIAELQCSFRSKPPPNGIIPPPEKGDTRWEGGGTARRPVRGLSLRAGPKGAEGDRDERAPKGRKFIGCVVGCDICTAQAG